MRYSLLFFANQADAEAVSCYDLLIRSTEFADSHGFEAVWLPERHFHPFGGAFPNPALAAAAVAAKTRRLRLRAGSVVLPLHDVLTIAEDWSVVDNISRGRVDIAFASGWNANDFVLTPDRYPSRHQVTLQMIKQFDQLWKGGGIERLNGEGQVFDTHIFPRPVQSELSCWLTCTASVDRFAEAGANGLNVLTALLFQTPDELKQKIEVYRAARLRKAGLPGRGHVTLMLHTFLGETIEQVREVVRSPFTRYLASSVSLWKSRWQELDIADEKNTDLLLRFAFQRYFRSAALFGTVNSCQSLVEKLAEAGVDEIACLIDFGLDNDQVLRGLQELAKLVQLG